MRTQAIGALAVLALAGISAAPVYAADYPERNITVVVPFPPGGASDVTARLVSNKLSERIGKSVIIETALALMWWSWGSGRRIRCTGRLHAVDRIDRRICDQSKFVQNLKIRSAQGLRSSVAVGA
jgi:hypothetical protein